MRRGAPQNTLASSEVGEVGLLHTASAVAASNAAAPAMSRPPFNRAGIPEEDIVKTRSIVRVGQTLLVMSAVGLLAAGCGKKNSSDAAASDATGLAASDTTGSMATTGGAADTSATTGSMGASSAAGDATGASSMGSSAPADGSTGATGAGATGAGTSPGGGAGPG